MKEFNLITFEFKLNKSKINKHYSIWSVNVAAMKILQNVENCGICVEIL